MNDLVSLVFGTFPSWSHLVTRLALGAIFFAHGAQKALGWFGGRGLKETIAGFRQMGIPPAATLAAALVECLGGLALIPGLLVRPAALGLIAVMVVAIAKVHARNGFFLNWSVAQGKGHGYEANLAFLAMAVACLIAGGGALSLDLLIVP